MPLLALLRRLLSSLGGWPAGAVASVLPGAVAVQAKLLLVGAMIAGIAWVGVVAVEYRATRKPLSQLPGLPAVGVALAAQPPGYLRALYAPAGDALGNPLGVAVAPAGDRIYVTQSGGERDTLVLDREGGLIGRLAPPGTQPAGRFPLYVAVDAAGTVYVSDRLRAAIDLYSPAGEHQGVYTPRESPPAAPLGLAFDRSGSFYVTDAPEGQHRLLVYNPDGTLRLSVGREGAGPGEFTFPNGVAVDAQGTIYVSDGNNGRVQVFDREGRLKDVVGRSGRGTLGIPRGVAVDSSRRLFVVDTAGQAVEVWDVTAEPRRLYTLGSEGSGDAQFSYPNGIALDSSGRVYVTDRVNGRVQVWSY